jgi:hypothetical protein
MSRLPRCATLGGENLNAAGGKVNANIAKRQSVYANIGSPISSCDPALMNPTLALPAARAPRAATLLPHPPSVGAL